MTSGIRAETIHRMGRRCRNWDYCCDAVYLITLVLADRSKPLLGRLVIDRSACPATGAIELTPLGAAIEEHWRRIGEFTPEIKPICCSVMPEHFHGVLWVKRRMKKPLGDAIRGFKGGCTKLFRTVAGATPQSSLFAEGYVDTILFDKEAFEKGCAYVADNPRRLALKALNPERFEVLRDLEIAGIGRFSAIGNDFLLNLPRIHQLQCSRRDFAYERNAKGEILRDAPPRLKTAAFDEKLAELRAEIAHGAAVVSPCISEGERELARVAFNEGARVITLQNKGFSSLYKPGGQLFDACAEGRLLMLAPIAWPYLPGKKPMTRDDACVLNRIAQLIAGSGAATINYRGVTLSNVDALVKEAVSRACPATGARR